MKSLVATTTLLLGTLALAGNAFADCAADSTPAEVRKAYANGQDLERDGKKRAALFAYVGAQAYICETNPVERDAARRAVALARELAPQAEAAGQLDEAFALYEAGGLYAQADRALIALLRRQPDSISTFERVEQTFSYRALEAFASNNEVRIAAAGGYTFDKSLLAEVQALPVKGTERALAAEAAAFNEQYLKELVAVVQSQPKNPLDMAGWQRAQAAQQGFAQKWPSDPVKASFDALEHARAWTVHVTDGAVARRFDERRWQRMTERAEILAQRYDGAPQLLESAKDYYRRQNLERTALDARLARVTAQAASLGASAEQAGALNLAVAYYEVADQDAKAQAARNRMEQQARAAMAPGIGKAQAQAEQLKAAYSDPAKVEALRQQALAAQKSIKEAQEKPSGSNARRADDLEKELGL